MDSSGRQHRIAKGFTLLTEYRRLRDTTTEKRPAESNGDNRQLNECTQPAATAADVSHIVAAAVLRASGRGKVDCDRSSSCSRNKIHRPMTTAAELAGLASAASPSCVKEDRAMQTDVSRLVRLAAVEEAFACLTAGDMTPLCGAREDQCSRSSIDNNSQGNSRARNSVNSEENNSSSEDDEEQVKRYDCALLIIECLFRELQSVRSQNHSLIESARRFADLLAATEQRAQTTLQHEELLESLTVASSQQQRQGQDDSRCGQQAYSNGRRSHSVTPPVAAAADDGVTVDVRLRTVLHAFRLVNEENERLRETVAALTGELDDLRYVVADYKHKAEL